MLKEGERFLQLLPEMASIGRENLDREMTRMVSGLDRLYTNSKSLTRGQVAESMEMSDKKVAAKFKQAQSGIQTRKNQLKDKVQPVVTSAQSELDKVLGAEYEALGKKVSLVVLIQLTLRWLSSTESPPKSGMLTRVSRRVSETASFPTDTCRCRVVEDQVR